MAETHPVGQHLPRIDGAEKARGEAIFAADVRLPHMLVAKLLPSPHAHAEILAIDTSQAEALPGVRAVITAADIPALDAYNPESRQHAFLARRFAVFAGQPVAAVAADDLTTAEAALDLIRVEYRPLPAVIDLQQALLPDSPALSHAPRPAGETEAEQPGSPNIRERFVFEHGDLAAALAESAVVVEHTYVVPGVHQGYIEPHAVTAFWDRPDHVTVWQCVQGAFEARDLLARTLGIPHTHITLNTTEIGGGFGGKGDGIFSPLAVLLARQAQRPVQLVLTRREELTAANPAPRTIIRLKTGAKRDGTLTALEGQILLDAGAFPGGSTPIGISFMLGHNYRFQAWRLESVEVLTNKASVGSYRAPGAINAAVAIESQLDEIAGRLGIDPLALRLQNVVVEGDPLLPNLRPQVPVGSREVLAALARHPAWTDPPPPHVGADRLLHGRGVALASWGSGAWPAAASAILEAGGKVRIVTGSVDLTGSFTSLAQIAAEALGISVQQIVVSKASPDHTPYAPVAGGSGTIYSMGAAVKEAALDLRARMLACAAEELKVAVTELAMGDAGVFVVGQSEQVCSFQKLYQLGADLFMARYGPLAGHGSLHPQKRAPVFAASVAEVAVDPETGQVTLTRLTTAQDVGQAINPLSVEGQIQGAAAQSVGIALWEEIVFDEDGQVRNPTLMDYRMPTAADMPPVETVLVEAPGGDGPYGAKGVGEPPMIPPVAAVANAVAAAIGTRIYELPITPEKVWRALRGQPVSEGSQDAFR